MATMNEEAERITAALHWPGWHESKPAQDPATRTAEHRYEPIPPGMKPWDGRDLFTFWLLSLR